MWYSQWDQTWYVLKDVDLEVKSKMVCQICQISGIWDRHWKEKRISLAEFRRFKYDLELENCTVFKYLVTERWTASLPVTHVCLHNSSFFVVDYAVQLIGSVLRRREGSISLLDGLTMPFDPRSSIPALEFAIERPLCIYQEVVAPFINFRNRWSGLETFDRLIYDPKWHDKSAMIPK